jgi:hypothetical protein
MQRQASVSPFSVHAQLGCRSPQILTKTFWKPSLCERSAAPGLQSGDMCRSLLGIVSERQEFLNPFLMTLPDTLPMLLSDEMMWSVLLGEEASLLLHTSFLQPFTPCDAHIPKTSIASFTEALKAIASFLTWDA